MEQEPDNAGDMVEALHAEIADNQARIAMLEARMDKLENP
jgi:hypothetical protein